MTENETTELVEIEQAVAACNAVAVADPVKIALVRDLKPIAGRLAEYAKQAAIPVETEADAKAAEVVCVSINEDIKAVKEHEVLSKITDGLHKLHKRWTCLRGLFVDPLTRDHKAIKGRIIAWQEAERRKAEEAQRKLQAEADAKAERERQALNKKAEAVKTQEKKEMYREQAAAVIAPTIAVEAPKTGIRVSRRWAVKSVHEGKFYAAISENPAMWGYCEINEGRLTRAKAANPRLEIPGVVFEQRTV